MVKPGVEAGAPGDSERIFHPHSPHPARPIFSMLKIAVLNVDANGFRMNDRNFFPYRPISSSDECQHADIAKHYFDQRWEKYSALYFFLVAGNEKRRDERANVLASTRGLADG